MSLEKVNVVLNHSAARGSARNILLGLASHHGADGRIYCSERRLSLYAGGITERNVIKALRQLEELGELKVLATGTGRLATEYALLLHCPPWCEGRGAHKDLRKTGEYLDLTWDDPP